MGYCQEWGAGNTVAALKKGLAIQASVVRNGNTINIEASDVVPGDIVFLDEVSLSLVSK